MKKILILTMVIGLLLGLSNTCESGDGYRKGMTREEAVKIFGQPAKKEINGPYEKWTYEWSGNLKDAVYFKNDLLQEVVRWLCDDKGRPLRIVDILY